MKRTYILTAILLGIMLVGCDDRQPPKAGVPAETAGQAMRNDNAAIAERLATQKAAVDAKFQSERAQTERLQQIESLTALGKRAGEAMDETGRATLLQIGDVGKRLESIKTDTDALAVNDCTGPARAALATAIAASLDVIEQYKRDKGIASEATRQKQQDALSKFDDYEKQLARCR